jgi:hypothetical protein
MHGLDRQRTTIGKFPVLSLADARAEAKRILAEHTLGKHRPKTIKWDAAVELFLEACKEKNKPRTVEDYTRLLARRREPPRRPLPTRPPLRLGISLLFVVRALFTVWRSGSLVLS